MMTCLAMITIVVFPLSVCLHVGRGWFPWRCLCASASPTYRSHCKFPVSSNPPPVCVRTPLVFTERVSVSLSLHYKVGRSALAARQENADHRSLTFSIPRVQVVCLRKLNQETPKPSSPRSFRYNQKEGKAQGLYDHNSVPLQVDIVSK